MIMRRELLVPVRNSMIFAGEVASSGGRLGRQHTGMRRPPPGKAGNQRGHNVEFGDRWLF